MVFWGQRVVAVIALLTGVFGASGSAEAHMLQPGYLELRLIGQQHYAVLWKTPAVNARPMSISAVLPANCDARTPPHSVWDGSAYIARWTTLCTGGLEGGLIRIEGLDQTSTDVLVRFDLAESAGQTRRLTPGNASFAVPVEPSQVEVLWTYLLLGIEHILSGFDHLLFVLALLLLVSGWRRLLGTITAFTLAHSITLAGATLGLITAPQVLIEALIALSIVFVAAEVVHLHQGRPSLTANRPWAIAFAFGLLHGFGFAAALRAVGLPAEAVPMALLSFNLGVEAGQIAFVLSLLTLNWAFTFLRTELPDWLRPAVAYGIGSLGFVWTVERIAGI